MNKGTCKYMGSKPGGHLTCEKGHDIRAKVGGENTGWMRRVPCHDPEARSSSSLPMLDPVSCDDYCEPTQEEVDVFEAEATRVINAVVANKCSECGKELTREGIRLVCRPCKRVAAII